MYLIIEMSELPTIQETMRFGDSSVRVSGQVYKDNLGCYRVKFDYHTYEDWLPYQGDIHGDNDLPLNGTGRNKMIKKVREYIQSQIW